MLITTGICCEKLGKLNEAIAFYLKALESPAISGEDATLTTAFIGQCYDKMGQHAAAFNYLNKVFTMNNRYDGGWYMLYRYATLAYQYGNYDISIMFFDKALSRNT